MYHGRFPKFPQQKGPILLERGTVAGIRVTKQRTAALLKYHWQYYSELAHQRNAIQDELKKILIQSCVPNYEFKQWQRAVKYKYGLHPLSTVGSLSFIGGRFNTGLEVNSEVPSFPALYLAKDKDTALQEHLGQEANKGTLTPRELALTNPASETIVSVSGHLDKVFDLTQANTLAAFVAMIKKFTLSKEILRFAKQLGLPKPEIVKTPQSLLRTLSDPNWRDFPSNLDIPANSQIFGHLVYSAGIEGILYPSKFTKSLCLAIFTRNFADTDSFLAMDDEVPHKKVPSRIDVTNWRMCELNVKEIMERPFYN